MPSRQPSLAGEVRALFDERGAQLAETAILQPADPFLDMAGEELRRRIFLTESETGETLCLRPEFTIPVCIDHIAARAGTPRRYAYLGEVFRQQQGGPAEFLQAGIEDLGERDVAGADARSIADAHALLVRLLPGAGLAVTLGDQGVFEAVLSGLGLPRGWRTRLARAFGSAARLAQALDDLAGPGRRGARGEIVAGLLADGDRAGLAVHIAEMMEEAGLSPTVGRTPQEIAERLIEKAELRRVNLPRGAFQALKRFLAIRAPLARAASELAAFCAEARLSPGPALELFATRAQALDKQGLDAGAVTYDAGFGRPLDYYTGLVFEISVAGVDAPLAGGGRYDRLLTLLGADRPIPGVGFSVWLDRVEAARRGGGRA